MNRPIQAVECYTAVASDSSLPCAAIEATRPDGLRERSQTQKTRFYCVQSKEEKLVSVDLEDRITFSSCGKKPQGMLEVLYILIWVVGGQQGVYGGRRRG